MAKDEMVQVPRAEIAELLGLPADTPEDVLLRKFYEGAAALAVQEEAQAVAAAEAAACAEDRRIVNAAYNAGKFPASRVEFWTDALKRDRERNRALVASLTPGLVPVEKIAADTDVEAVHNKVIGQLGFAPKSSPRAVAASGDPFADGRERAVLDAFGLPVADVPPPVLLRKGTNVEDYTQEQHFDRFMNMLGGKFKASAKPLPQGDSWYLPSPNDTSEFKNGQWVPKRPYRELGPND
jgi:hypothetical protein